VVALHFDLVALCFHLKYLYFTGIDAFTSVFVRKGGDVFLNVSEAAVPKDYHLLLWKFVPHDVLVAFFPSGKSSVRGVYVGRIDLLENKHSIKLKNLQKSDSGLYTAIVTATSEEVLAEHKVTVQASVDPVGPVDLTVSMSSDSSSCNLTATCTADGTDINSTFRCAAKTCLQEGGEGPKVTKSGASLHLSLSCSSIVCNHSNQVSWTEKTTEIDHLCPKNAVKSEKSLQLVNTKLPPFISSPMCMKKSLERLIIFIKSGYFANGHKEKNVSAL
uniref:Immunoglobulin V-set domain-containing protein n=1 Tax=Poecilia formosa TaxID=48698 RepID=A0A087XBU9_POEFO